MTNARTVLIIAALVSMIDRSVLPPLVPVIASEMGARLEEVAPSLTVYAVAYAALQLVWSALSTRLGRVRVLAISTGLAGVANLGTALAFDPGSLIAMRGISGAAFAATFTAVLVYLGDTLTMAQRAVATANLAAAVAFGLAFGTVAAGVVAQWWSWRYVFVAIAVACLALTILLSRLTEPATGVSERLVPSIARLSRNSWALGILSLTVVEGVLLVGVFNFLPVALQEAGVSVLIAGLVTAAFGVTVIVVSQSMKLVLGKWPSWVMLLVAGAAVTGAYLVLTIVVSPVSVLTAAGLMGLAWAFGHTTLQTWMTDAVHDGRAIGMSFFSISLFVGASVGAALGTNAASAGSFAPLFAGAAVASVGFAAAASVARARYRVRDELAG